MGKDIKNENREESITDNQASILEGIIESQAKEGAEEGTTNKGENSKISRREAKKLFKLLSDFSNVEWQLVAYTNRFEIGTIHNIRKSPAVTNLKKIQWIIHSHPERNGTMGPSGENKYRLSGDYNVANERRKIIGVSMPHFVYHRYSGRVYYYDTWSYCRTYFFE